MSRENSDNLSNLLVSTKYVYTPRTVSVPSEPTAPKSNLLDVDINPFLESAGFRMDNKGNYSFRPIESKGVASITLGSPSSGGLFSQHFSPYFYVAYISPPPSYSHSSLNISISTPSGSPPSAPSLSFSPLPPVSLPVNLIFPSVNIGLTSFSIPEAPQFDIGFPFPEISLLDDVQIDMYLFRDINFDVNIKGTYFNRVRRDINEINKYFRREREYLYNKYLALMRKFSDLKDLDFIKGQVELLINKEMVAFEKYLSNKEMHLLKLQLQAKIASESVKASINAMRSFLDNNRAILRAISDANNAIYQAWDLAADAVIGVNRANVEILRYNARIPSKMVEVINLYNQVLNEYSQYIQYAARAEVARADIQVQTYRLNAARLLENIPQMKFDVLNELRNALIIEQEVIRQKYDSIKAEAQAVSLKYSALSRLTQAFNSVLSAQAESGSAEVAAIAANLNANIVNDASSYLNSVASLMLSIANRVADLNRTYSSTVGKINGIRELNKYFTSYGSEVNKLITALSSHVTMVAGLYGALQTRITSLLDQIKQAEIVTHVKETFL